MPGSHMFPFCFHLPEHSPPSYEGKDLFFHVCDTDIIMSWILTWFSFLWRCLFAFFFFFKWSCYFRNLRSHQIRTESDSGTTVETQSDYSSAFYRFWEAYFLKKKKLLGSLVAPTFDLNSYSSANLPVEGSKTKKIGFCLFRHGKIDVSMKLEKKVSETLIF